MPRMNTAGNTAEADSRNTSEVRDANPIATREIESE
jgi:hypothetical protein